MITYGSTTLTSYNTITKIEVYYYKSTSATSLSGGSWSTTKPTWENGKYIWQKIRTTYEGKLDNGSYYSESDPVNITGQQGATGTSAYSYKLNASDTIVSISKNGIYSTNNITFSATYKQGTGAISAYAGRFKIETTADGATWTTQYTSSANESSKKITLPENILVIRCSLYQAGGTTVLLDIVSVPIVKDGTDGALYPNLTPFFSHDLSDVYNAETNPNGYWVEYSSYGWTKNSAYTFTQLEDGWLHVHVDNSSGTTTIRNDCCIPRYNPSIKRATMYTFLVEFRNNQSTGVASESDFYLVQQSGSVQFWGQNPTTAPAEKLEGIGWVITQIASIPSDGSYAISRFTKYSEPEIGSTSHWTAENDMMATFTFRANAGAVLDYDVRLSVYEGEYWGNYVPYIISDVTDIRNSAKDAHYKIDNMEIGGRNLLLNTDKFDLHKHSNSSGGGAWTFSGDEATYTATAKSWARLDLSYNPDMPSADISSQPNMDLLGNTTIILSIEAKCEGECNGSLYLQQIIYGNNNNRKYYPLTNPTADCRNTFVLTENWQRYSVTIPADYTNTTYWTSDSTQLSYPNTGFGAIIYWNSTGTVHVRKPKLERGQKATDWTPAPEDTQADIDTALAQSVEYIIGTQTVATGAWTGKASTLSELKDGTQIRYWLPYAGNGNATLNLTLKDGTETDAIPVYRQGGSASSTGVVTANRVTTHFPAGTSISMVYGVNRIVSAVYSGTTYTGTFTGWFADGAYDSGNTVNRTRLQNAITAETAITAAHIICGTATGYKNIGAGIKFDLSYPILYASSAIAATKTGDNNYLQINAINASNNGTITSGAAKKVLYLKGTVSGNIFTISASPFMTTVAPTSADGFYYIPLGMMYSTTAIYFISSNRLYAYIDGAFQPVDTAAVMRAQDAKNLATAVYGTCSTAADTPLKEVVCENFILFDGVRIQVAFENANSTNVPSLNVNNTGAKQILINQAIVSESNQLLWAEDAQMEFVYDGTYWVLQNAPYSLYGICSVTEEIPEKVIECAEAVICKGTTITIDFMYSNTSDNTVFNVANIAQKPLLVNGDVLKVNSRFNWHAGAIRTFYFDGQAWNMSDDIVSAYIDEYETEQNEDGIMVHPVGQKNTGWSIGSTLELLKNGVSYIKMWFDKVEEGEFSLPFIRIGKESGNHVLVGDDAVTIREDQKELAHYSSLGITFNDETPYKIGNDTTYIAFEDTDNDAKADSLRIVADSISFHSNGTEKDLRSELEGLNENIDLNAQAIEQNAEAIENTQKYIQIDPEVPSIKLATNDRNYLLIESNKLGFWVDANETAYMSQNQMNIPTASITNLLMQTTNAETGETIGQIGWVMRTNGHLSLKIMN